MTISLTNDHIKNGLKFKADKCPVALAIKDSFPGVKVMVSVDICIVDWNLYSLPDEVNRFIEDFDAGVEGLKPFEFELPIELEEVL